MNKNPRALFSRQVLRHVIFSAFLEFGPVLFFLASFERVSIYESTLILMLTTIISTVVTYRLQKRIPYLALYVACITTLFGYMTLHFHEVRFIQMRDTLYDVTCALTLIIGMVLNKSFLKMAFHSIIPMTGRAWDTLTHLWLGYFLFTAIANEMVRRLLPLPDWFLFKGVVVLSTAIFGLSALYYSYEEYTQKKGNENSLDCK